MNTDKITEAIAEADTGPHRGLYRRMAEAAVAAMELDDLIRRVGPWQKDDDQ